MQYRELIQQVARELPFPSPEGPQKAVEATLTALFEAVPEHSARAVLEAFPGAPAALASASRRRGETTFAGLRSRAATLLGKPEPHAMEQVQTVCAVLDRALTGDERTAFMRTLPDELLVLFEPRVIHTPSSFDSGRGHTLADGAPGSAHSLSKDSPGSRHPLSAGQLRPHEHSVAEANPHGDTKLSSARGLTQEREHESLSEGRSKRS